MDAEGPVRELSPEEFTLMRHTTEWENYDDDYTTNRWQYVYIVCKYGSWFIQIKYRARTVWNGMWVSYQILIHKINMGNNTAEIWLGDNERIWPTRL